MDYSKLSNAEIDALCADAIGEYVDEEGDRVELRRASVTLDRHDGAMMRWPSMDNDAGVGERWHPWCPSLGAECEDVKRDIERRGWNWTCEYKRSDEGTKMYRFRIALRFGENNARRDERSHVDRAEARACCVAFLLAVEATKGER